jgi:hypothetical protein
VTQAPRVVHVFIPGEPAEERLTKHADKAVTTVLPRARVRKKITSRRCQAKCIVEFAVREQTGIGGDDGAAKLDHDHM